MPPKGSKKSTAGRGRVSQHGNGWRVRASIGASTVFGPTRTREAEADADLRLAQAASSEAQYVHVLQQLRATNELSTQQVQPSEPCRKRLRAKQCAIDLGDALDDNWLEEAAASDQSRKRQTRKTQRNRRRQKKPRKSSSSSTWRSEDADAGSGWWEEFWNSDSD